MMRIMRTCTQSLHSMIMTEVGSQQLVRMTAGMRMRLPESLLAGMMWFDPRRPDALANLRHEAQERDGGVGTEPILASL